MTSREIIQQLKSLANPKNIEGMKRFAVGGANTLGISIPTLRQIAKDIKKADADRHKLSLELWESGIHEAKILASMIDEPEKVTSAQMDSWIKDFDSWDICDQVCMNLFCLTEQAEKKIGEWVKRKTEFERRAGFVILTTWAWKRKELDDKTIAKYLPLTIEYATDERNYVRKAVNWALRQIGKRNANLKKEAITTSEKILEKYPHNKTALWIARDAIRELKRS